MPSFLLALAFMGPLGGTRLFATTLEYQVKAAMIYNFAKFVEWPATESGDQDRPFVVGVLGRDPFGSTIDDALRGKSVFGRKIELRRYATPADLTSCEILFVSRSENGRLDDVLAAIEGQSVLTVGDMDGFAEYGGVIEFVIEHQTIRFLINVESALRSGLRISSKLQRLAVKPKDRSAGRGD